MKKLILFAVLLSLFVWATVVMPANRSFFLSEGNAYLDTTWTLPDPAQEFTCIVDIANTGLTVALTFTGSVTDHHSGTTTSMVDSIKVEGTIGNVSMPMVIEYDHGYPVTTVRVRRSANTNSTVTIIPHN